MAYQNDIVYTNLRAEEYYTKMLFSTPLLSGTWDYPGPFFKTMIGVKGTVVTPIIELDHGLQAASCNHTAADSLTVTPRTITTCKMAACYKVCKDQFAGTQWIDDSIFSQKAGARNDGPNPTMQGIMMKEGTAKTKESTNILMLRGNPDNGYEEWMEICAGLLYRLNDDTDPEYGNISFVDGQVITVSNVYTEMDKAYEAMDPIMAEILYNGNLGGEERGAVRWLMHPRQYMMLRQALNQQNTNYPGLTIERSGTKSRLYFNDIPVFFTNAMPENEMLIYAKDHAIWATDLVNDVENVVVKDMSESDPRDKNIVFDCEFYMGMAYREGRAFTYYRPI